MNVDLRLLTEVGLTETEAQIYLSLLELGEATVVDIAKVSRVKRPTCYVNLDSMVTKGFTTKLNKNNRLVYAAVDPQIILRQLKSKVLEFEDLVPYYRSKLNSQDKPQILFYEGKDELKSAYKRVVFNEKSKRLYAFGTDVQLINEVFPDLYKDWENYYVNQFSDIKEIVNNNQAGKDYVKKHSNPANTRLMPAHLPVSSDTLITDSKVFIVSLENLFGILIDSKDLADTYTSFFELAWSAADLN